MADKLLQAVKAITDHPIRFIINTSVHTQENGDQRMVVTNIVEDPVYLQLPWTTAIHFKKEANGSKWDPTRCDARF